MKSEDVKIWIAALRSGKYKQSRTALNGRDGFCCLGVLCDISGQGKWVERDDGISRYVIGDEMYVTVLPAALCDHYEIPELGFDVPTEVIAKYTSFDCETSLAALNDRGATFEEIANILEDHYVSH